MTSPRSLSQKGCSTSSRCTPDQSVVLRKHAHPRRPLPTSRPSCIHVVETLTVACSAWRDGRETRGQSSGEEPCNPERTPRESSAKRKSSASATAWASRSNGSATQSNGSATQKNGSAAKSADAATPAAHYISGLPDMGLSFFDSGTARVSTEFVAETLLPTTSGKYRLRGYRHTLHKEDGSVSVTEPSAIMTGNPEGKENVVVRVHDACFTSEVLGSLKCDCADQLQLAMDYIQEHPGGLVIYLQQEGRGIGLANKIAAYALQEQGLDTVDANRQLGLPDDAREYTSVRNILQDLDIRSIRLMTNNPRKIEVLQSLGVNVTRRIPCIVTAQKHNLGYLSTKQTRMRHMLSQDEDEEPELDGSFCIWNHNGEALPPSVFSNTRGPLQNLIDERELRADRRPEVKDVEKSMDES